MVAVLPNNLGLTKKAIIIAPDIFLLLLLLVCFVFLLHYIGSFSYIICGDIFLVLVVRCPVLWYHLWLKLEQ